MDFEGLFLERSILYPNGYSMNHVHVRPRDMKYSLDKITNRDLFLFDNDFI